MNVEIVVREDRATDVLAIEIADDGKGMSAEDAEKAADPFFTTRTTRRIGLGLALLDEAARMTNGRLEVRSAPGSGTRITATFQLSNIDRKPLGDMAATVVMLVAGNPDINFIYRYEHDGQTFIFDTKEIRSRLHGLDMHSPEALTFIREYITEHTESLS